MAKITKITVKMEDALKIIRPLCYWVGIRKIMRDTETGRNTFDALVPKTKGFIPAMDDVEKMLDGYKFNGVHIEHVTGDTKKYWIRTEKEVDSFGEEKYTDVGSIGGEFETKEEANAFIDEYEKEHPDEDMTVEVIEFDPDEGYLVMSENAGEGHCFWCEEAQAYSYPVLQRGEAVAIMLEITGRKYHERLADYFMEQYAKTQKERKTEAEKRLLKSIFGEE